MMCMRNYRETSRSKHPVYNKETHQEGLNTDLLCGQFSIPDAVRPAVGPILEELNSKKMEKRLRDEKLLGSGADKLQGDDRHTLELQCKTAISEAIELCREFETKEEKRRTAKLRIVQCKLHVNGNHEECPENSKCLTTDSFLLRDQHKFGEKERSRLNKAIFDDFLLTTKFIDENCLSVESTSANENLHWVIYGRGLISKKHHKNLHTNSIEAGYKCGVLYSNEGSNM